MADSFSKKENNKKKAQKRQEKALKKEERKTNNNKGKELEDMLVYVDYNGNLTHIPPGEQDIEAAKRELEERLAAASAPDLESTGVVTYFSDKGFGFITEDNSKENIFVHSSQSNQPLQQGDKVTFRKERTPRGLSAIEVNKI